jgi:CheY-like chemotaxis protein
MNEPIPLFPKKEQIALVVDDDSSFQCFMSELLEQEGYTVKTANDGREGLQKYKIQKPHLIVTDIIMPDSEGLEFIMEVRKTDTLTPIVAVSGGNFGYGEKYLRLAKKFGVNAIFPKPFELDDFIEAIKGFNTESEIS